MSFVFNRQYSVNQDIRVPNLPIGQMVDSEGNPTNTEMTFRQALITSLQTNFSSEGLVAPIQNPTTLPLIQDNAIPDPVTGLLNYTCLPGTILYVQHPTDYTQDKVMIAVRNSNIFPSSLSPVLFKTVTLT